MSRFDRIFLGVIVVLLGGALFLGFFGLQKRTREALVPLPAPVPWIVLVRSCDPLAVEWAWSDQVRGGPATFRCPAEVIVADPVADRKALNVSRRRGYQEGEREGWEHGYRQARKDALASGTAGWR